MGLKAGIVGLPNVGKSTLFNAITKKNILAANYPFATIDPNVGVVTVPDKRLEFLQDLYQTESVVPTTYEFTDIAGLVKGASKGEGLGNQFLGNIRNCDAICHVVRCFEDENVTHVESSVDPLRDIETINLELIFADIETVGIIEAEPATISRTFNSCPIFSLTTSINENCKPVFITAFWKVGKLKSKEMPHATLSVEKRLPAIPKCGVKGLGKADFES